MRYDVTRLWVTCFTFLFVSACAGAPESTSGQGGETINPTIEGDMLKYKNLTYDLPAGTESNLAKLDIFRTNDELERPLVLLVHGGSWASGDKAGFEAKLVPWWVQQGYVAVPVNFRLATKPRESPIVKPRDQVQDLASSLAWLMDHAEEYHINREKIVLFGYSSGAHLVALLGTDESILQEAGLHENQVVGSISFDVHAYDVPYALSLMEGSEIEDNMRIIRHLFGMTEMEQLSSSPIQFVDGWAAKALVVSVDADPAVEGTHGYIVSKSSERYVTALETAGHDAETVHDITETHSSLVAGFGERDDLATDAVKAFIDRLP